MKKSRFIAGAIFFGAGAFVLFTLVVMWLWNWLMPAIFSLGTITIWQAAGLLLLSKILFSGGGHAKNWHSDRKKKFWHNRFEEKWKKIPGLMYPLIMKLFLIRPMISAGNQQP